jgi:chromosome segregation ATPase
VLLGALTTALIALIALPAVSRRAFRLAQAKARLTAPLSAAEARAERDALRGRHAVDLALAERRADAAEDQWAEAQIGLGQRAAEIARRDAELADKTEDIARLREELAAQGRELDARDAEIAAREVALHDLSGQRDAAERRRDEETARLDALKAQLEARIAALVGEIGDLRHSFERALAVANSRAAELKRDLSTSEATGRRLAEQGREMHERLSDSALRENELKLRLQALAAARVEAEGEARVARAERELTARETNDLRQQLAASQARAKSLSEADEALRRTIARLGREMVAGRAPEAAQTPADRETAS